MEPKLARFAIGLETDRIIDLYCDAEDMETAREAMKKYCTHMVSRTAGSTSFTVSPRANFGQVIEHLGKTLGMSDVDISRLLMAHQFVSE